MTSCTFTNRTAKLNYNSKSNSVKSKGIVERKYQKGFYVNLFKSKIFKKNSISANNINLPIATETPHTKDEKETNDVAQTLDDNSNLIASNNVIVFAKSNLHFYPINRGINKEAKSVAVKSIKQKQVTSRKKLLSKKVSPNQDKRTENARNILIILGWILWLVGFLIMLSSWGVATATATYSLGLPIFTIGGLMTLIGYIMKK